MNAREFLAKKGVHNLDTKKRYNEVISWMEEYAALRQPPVSGRLISWQTYLKANPQKYQVNDFIGSRTVVVPTLKANGFTILDYNEYYKGDIKPKDLAKEALKGIDFKEAVYCSMTARDGHCHWVTVGYK